MRRTLPIAVAFSVLLFAATPAQSAKIADTQSYGPIALAGNAVVYSVFRQGDAAVRLRLARPGRESRLVFSQRLSRGFKSEPTVAIPAASSRRVGLITMQERGNIERGNYSSFRELWTGRPTGPFKLVTTTRGSRNRCLGGPMAVAVGDNALVTIVRDCSGQRVVVRDYAKGGAPKTIARAEMIKALAATGHFVAWVQRTYRSAQPHWTYTLVIYDRSRNRVVYRIPKSGWPDYLSVQADGKVVGQSAQGPLVTAWFSATARTRHVLPAGSVTPPRLAADRLLFTSGLELGATGPVTLSLRDLTGSQTTVATFPAGQFQPDPVQPSADYDGRRVAFIQRGCGSANEIWLLDATGPASTAPACS